MRTKRMILLISILVFALMVTTAQGMAANDFMETGGCTIIAVGKDASVNGTAMITHNDDSSGADFRLWIIPAMDWPEGSMRDIVVDSHNYIDFGNWPKVDYTENDNVAVVGQIPQVAHTYRYFHSRYSFMNEMGVAMGESTFGVGTHMPKGEDKKRIMEDESEGIIDCWYAQDIALERAKTAREAVRIMGDLVEEFGWLGPGETMDITDGDEVWIAEFYGRDVWCAVKIPNDHIFVAANMARIRDVDLSDTENVMHSPNLISFAEEQGWYDPNSGEPFQPADIYAPHDQLYSTRRVWRVSSLVAPSLVIDPDDIFFPLSVKPEKKLSVHDVFKLKGDYYQGTEFDISTGPAAGPFGDPLRYPNTPGHNERAITIMRTCYIHIGEVDPNVPAPFKGVSWYGYGSPDSTYLTPLWPIMKELPIFYEIGSRYEPFRRDSGWWINTYTQEMAQLNYQAAIQDIYALRDPKLQGLYEIVPKIQETAAGLYQKSPEAAIQLVSDFAYNTAVGWNKDWEQLGNVLLAKYWSLNTRKTPKWFDEVSEKWANENMPRIGKRLEK